MVRYTDALAVIIAATTTPSSVVSLITPSPNVILHKHKIDSSSTSTPSSNKHVTCLSSSIASSMFLDGDDKGDLPKTLLSITSAYLDSLSEADGVDEYYEELVLERNLRRRRPKIVVDGNSFAANRVTMASTTSTTKSVAPQLDEVAEEGRKQQSSFSYTIELPLVATSKDSSSYLPSADEGKPIGLEIRQVFPSSSLLLSATNVDATTTDVADMALALDTLQLFRPSASGLDDYTTLREKLLEGGIGEGLVVSHVVEGGLAWEAGVRVGDLLVSSSATIGKKMWPKSSLDGLKSAILSRRVMNQSMKFQFRREAVDVASTTSTTPSNAAVDTAEVVEEFELTLSRPLGIQVAESDDGYVCITGFTGSDTDLAGTEKGSLRVGDRIVAVDSTVGNQMWPVSNVEGLVSAVTARLPGQSVCLRFERVVDVQEDKDDSSGLDLSSTTAAFTTVNIEDGSLSLIQTSTGSATSATSSNSSLQGMARRTQQYPLSKTQNLLLKRCRDAIKQYQTTTTTGTKLLAAVADRVLEALVDSSTPVDSKTLTLIMNSYLSSQKPESAIMAFEASTGFSASAVAGASIRPQEKQGEPCTTITGKKDTSKTLIPNANALSYYTATALLRAHSMMGNIESARMVLEAMEGTSSTDHAHVITNAARPDPTWVQMMPKEQFLEMDSARNYNVVLAAAAKAGAHDHTHRTIQIMMDLFDLMSEPNTRPSPMLHRRPSKTLISYNIVINALARAGRSEEAFRIYDSMPSTIQPDKFTFTSLIKACLNTNQIERAKTLLYQMADRGTPGDVLTYNMVIQALCNRYQWYQAKTLISDMEFYGISPDSKTYGLLMSGLLKADKPGPCLTLFNAACADEKTAGLMENVYLFTTAITAASKLGDDARALGLVARMATCGIQPNVKTFTALMNSCLGKGKIVSALDVYSKIGKPDGYAMTLGVRAYSEGGDFRRALDLITTQKGLKPNDRQMTGKQIMESYNYALQASLAKNNFTAAREIFTTMLKQNFIPSKRTFNIIMEALKISPTNTKRRHNNAASYQKHVVQSLTDDRFHFILFVLDSLRHRNLPCDGAFYASILFEGSKLGGLKKKIASLISLSKKMTDAAASSSSTNQDGHHHQSFTWEELIQQYSEYKEKSLVDGNNNSCLLPKMNVRVNGREIRQVLSAERSVSYGGRTISNRKKNDR